MAMCLVDFGTLSELTASSRLMLTPVQVLEREARFMRNRVHDYAWGHKSIIV